MTRKVQFRPRPRPVPVTVENILARMELEVRYNHPLSPDGQIEFRATWRKRDKTSVTCIVSADSFDEGVLLSYRTLNAKHGYRLW